MENTLRPPVLYYGVTSHHNPVSLPPPPQFHVITVIVGLEFLLILRQFMMF